MNKNLLSAILFLIVIFNCKSQTVYVNQTATGLNNGTSWQNAYTNLSTAINSTVSGQIWVAQGTYIPTTDLNGQIPANPRLNTFKLKLNIAIYGGFNGSETYLAQRNWTNYPTILSGNIGDPGVIQDNLLHVLSSEYVNLNSNTILDGLTIKDGYAMFLNGASSYTENGGGINVYQTTNGSFKIKNCIIEENYSEGTGGGIYIFNCDPIIENCIFRNNVAFTGGGMYFSYCDAVISNCQFNQNYASYAFSYGQAGGIYIGSYSSPKIFNCSFTNNNATYEGGALYNDSNYELTFNNNIVSGNHSRDGGALFLDGESYLFNNLFFNNSATWNGGSVYMDYSSFGEFINNTVVQNTAGTSGGGLYTFGPAPNITNSIFYSNSSPLGPQIRAYNNAGSWAPAFRYCNIQGGLTDLASYGNPIIYQDNLDVNPLFIDSTTNDFHLLSTSALINAGTMNPSIVASPWSGNIYFPSTDLDGYQRIVGSIDIGAYEFGSSLGIHSTENFNFIIYPNPSNGIFNINSNTDYESLSVFNTLGQELFHKVKESELINIDLTHYPSGLYFVHLFKNNKKYTFKIIKK